MNSTMKAMRSALSGLVLSLLVTGCNPIEFFRNPNVRGAPASNTWIEVHHPTLPLVFEVPKNIDYEKDGTSGLNGMGIYRGPSGELQLLDLWGIRMVFDGFARIHAFEFCFARLEDGIPGVNARSIAELTAGLDAPEAAIQFVRDVYLKVQGIDNVEFTDLGQVEISGLVGRRLRGRFVHSAITATYDVTLLPEFTDRVWVISAEFFDATAQEHEEIYPRILRSVRILKPDWTLPPPDHQRTLRLGRRALASSSGP